MWGGGGRERYLSGRGAVISSVTKGKRTRRFIPWDTLFFKLAERLTRNDISLRGRAQFPAARLIHGNNPLCAWGIFPLQSTVTSLIVLYPQTTLRGWPDRRDYPHFLGEEMEAWKTSVVCPGSQGKAVIKAVDKVRI